MLLEVYHLLTLGILEGTHALEHLVPIDQGSIKLRTVDADELGLASDGQAAGATHTRSVHHDGVEGNVGREIVFLGQEAAELHHDRRTDGKDLVDVLLVDEFLDTNGYHAFLAVATVIGHDDEFVAGTANFLFHDDQFLVSSGDDREHSVASCFQGTDDREHRGYADTTTSTDDRTEILDVGRISERTYHVVNLLALIECAEFGRGEPYLLNHQGDSSLFDVGIGNGERHTLTVGIHTDDDEVTCLAALGNQWCFHIEAEYLLRVLYFSDNLVHSYSWFLCCMIC